MPHSRLIEPPKGAKKQVQGTIGVAAPLREPKGPRLSPFVQRSGGLGIATKKPIPNRHERGKVTIAPVSIYKVMRPVKGRGNPKPAQRAFKSGRKAEIRVVKLGRGTYQRLEKEPSHGGWAKHGQPKCFSKAGQKKLPGVEAKSCGDVQGPIAVVNLMEPPQEGHPVVGSMPEIIKGIEHEHGKEEFGDAHQSDGSNQAPALLLEPYGPKQQGYKNQGTREDGVDGCQRTVTQPARAPGTQAPPCRP